MRPVKGEDGERFSGKDGQEVQPSRTDSNGEMMDKEDDAHPRHPFLEPNVENAKRAKC